MNPVRTTPAVLLPLCLLTLRLAVAAPPASNEQNQLDGSKSLFAVMAAINVAGYDAELDAASTLPYRHQLRQRLATREMKSLSELKRFFAEHRKPNARDEAAQYITYALSVDGPPDFKWRYSSDRTPPMAAALEALTPILVEFWKEADLEREWKAAQPVYDEVIARYHEPVTNAILQANLFLRNPTSGVRGRRFQIYVDLLGAPNQIHTRNFSEDYFVVATPSQTPRTADIRRAYLHFVIDPLMILRKDEVEQKRSLCRLTEFAPALSDIYKQDCVLLFGMSMVRAIEARLDQKPEEVEAGMREGFVLTAAFADALTAYEKQEASMRFALKDMILALNTRKEARRIEGVQFVERTAERKVTPSAEPAVPTANAQLLQELDKVDALIKARELEQAREICRKIIEANEATALRARAYFGLAKIAALDNDASTSRELFEKTLSLGPDPFEKAWSHVYLARIAMASRGRDNAPDRMDEAIAHYAAALQVSGASEQARAAAQTELQAAQRRKQQ